MRKVFAALFISLDGVTESPELWQFEHFDEDMGALLAETIEAQDAMLLGRVTYQEWEPYWPTAKDEPFASHINRIQKYVVSTSLDQVKWGDRGNITLINSNLAQEIGNLKQRPGKDIGVAGSPTLVRSLLQNDLLDELTLMVHPVVANTGKHLFNNTGDLKRLKLAQARTTRTGVALLTYHPRVEESK